MDKRLISTISVFFILAVGGYFLYNETQSPAQPSSTSTAEGNPQSKDVSNQTKQTESQSTKSQSASEGITLPISDAASRITKKMYGTYVTPKNSPVNPEVFTGYHTGTDFETTPIEANIDVVIKAICQGKTLRKTTAVGYGGYLVQSCTINNQAVTVLYGHLRISSVAPSVGTELKPGDTIGLLGTGYSSETSNERKHLHLSIHIGSGVNIAGYVQNKSSLSGWINPQTVLGL